MSSQTQQPTQSKNFELWENYDRFYDDFQKENLNFDDLLIKSKTVFSDKNWTFSTKSKFNFDKTVSAAHEFTAKVKCNKGSLEIKDKPSPATKAIEYEGEVYSEKNLNVGALIKTNHVSTPKQNTHDAKVQLRFSNNKNTLVALGVEEWNVCGKVPKLFTLGASYGSYVDSAKVVTNGLVKYSLENRFIDSLKFFVKATKGDLTTLVQTNVNLSKTDDKVSSAVDLSLSFVKQVDSRTKVGGNLTHDINSKKSHAEVVGIKTFDKVKVTGKINSKREIFGGISTTGSDIIFTASGKVKINSEVESDKKTNIWLEKKFGVSVEFSRI